MNWIFPEKIMGSLPSAIAVFVLTAGCLTAVWADAAAIEGRLVRDAQPVLNGKVAAYTGAGLEGDPIKVSALSAADGRYSLDLSPGTYYLTASGEGLWSYCGQNPVTVQDGADLWIGFDLVKWEEPAYRPLPVNEQDGQIRGKVTLNGKSAEGVTVSVYLDASDNFRGMAFIRSVPTGPDGEFQIDMVPESRYYLLARRRGSGRTAGPMMKGDLFSYYRHNPVQVRGGQSLQILFPLVRKRQDRDVHAVGNQGKEVGFSGVIRDADGRSLSGIHVFAYLEPEMGHFKPAAISSQTDENGRYRIFLPAEGTYYIGARGGFGDSPEPGEMFGFFEGSPDHSLMLGNEEFKEGIDITVKRVLSP